ncbi:uncharacterized protein N7479_009382 [Penicillium vulpinum]|uniref:Protein kinase domain-containing protein n=1 Tax=Penicillium vulpinum TaxID=29845 RepID=A0A1V6RU96_9EURO|nr:uncharacterized protein N7479_009382 [Penicillium vulpinum]KAJ5950969.1 hypothetical protein N7479_009382 [Penicillium vulpinum]OQE05341.1 hypothetical protein PENVUL_c025G02206 [Penicillium vulpinum]
MDQTYEEWRHLIEGLGQGTGKRQPPTLRNILPSTPSNTSLIPHLEGVHHVFAQALNVDIRLMIWPQSWFPGDERLSPMQLRPWIQFPQLQEEMWDKIFNASEFVNASIFPPNVSLQYTAQLLKWYTVDSEDSMKQFAHRTLDDFLGFIINFLDFTPSLKYAFGVRGELNFDRPRHCCISVAKFGFEEPAYAVLYIPPFCLSLPELVAGLRAISPIDVFDTEPNTFEEHATAIVVRVIVRLYSRMVGAGIRFGYIYTGEALVFVHIPRQDSTIAEYYLCVPGRDVLSHGYDLNSNWVRRTALGQVLAFTLQSLAASPPPHEWSDAMYQTYRPLERDYSMLMPQAPEDIRCRPPPRCIYENSFWPGFWVNFLHANIQTNDAESPGLQTSELDISRPFCTQECLLGTFNKGILDDNCPNVAEHGMGRHQITSEEICNMLNEQLRGDRYRGFQQLHIVGRTGYLIKATLRSHGYTMLIKATSTRQSRRIKTELSNYQSLRKLQGSQIPVCLGMFQPKIPYWYHGIRMSYMLLLSWSGIRTDEHATLETTQYMEQEMRKLEDILKEHGAIQKDAAFRNLLWNPISECFVMIDLEDLKWVKGTAQGSERHQGDEQEFNTDSIRECSS